MENAYDGSFWDLVLLNPLTEEVFVNSLCCLYKQDQIYAYIGSELISVNPFKKLKIYSKEVALTYFHEAPLLLPPHLFSVVNTAYHWVNYGNEDQCIMTFGESGSGKTESLKIMLNFLSYVVCDCDLNVIEMNHIKHANVIFEAFGNAETSLNINSSRFANFLDIEFNYKGEPVSANFILHLFDKNRVSYQSLDERNYHIFYQLLSGADVYLMKTLKLQRNIFAYSILQHNQFFSNSDQDKKKFIRIKKSMDALSFSDEYIISIFKIISVVLKLGNLIFVSVTNIDGTEGCTISNEHEIYDICQLLGVDSKTFQSVMTSRTVYVTQNYEAINESESIKTELSAEEASHYRNCLCETLYSRLFKWIGETINAKIKVEPQCKQKRVCFLDLFGFEKFQTNGFYQFVVNYCNEKIFQATFEKSMQTEQEEYVREGLEWTAVDNVDSTFDSSLHEKIYEELILLLEHPFKELKETNSYLNQKLMQVKMLTELAYNPEITAESPLCQSNNDKVPFTYFRVKHYITDVKYDISKLLHKNSVLDQDVSIMMFSGTHLLLKKLFPEGLTQKSGFRKQPSPIGKQIKIALNNILRNINGRKLYFVRCIKPNDLKEPSIFDANIISNQIRSQKILETVRLRRNGFAFNLSYSQFLNRYKMLSLKTWPNSRLPPVQSIQYLIHDLPIPSAEFSFGSSKIFVRSPRSLFELEEYRCQRLNDIVVIIQSFWKKYFYRKKFLRIRRSQIIIAKAWRFYKKKRDCGIIRRNSHLENAVRVIQRQYIQWKRYQFLLHLAKNLPPRTLSPINQEWPSVSMRFTETSLLLRRLYHKWRCLRYRREFNENSRNKMREKVTASFLFKNRKCCYAESVSKPFIGDYVRLRQNNQWKKICSVGNDRYVVFADIINKIARSTGKFIPMLLVVSTNSLIIMDQKSLEIKYYVPASDIYRISVSPFSDNIVVVHIQANEKSSIDDDSVDCFTAPSTSSSVKLQTGCFFVSDYEKGDIIFQTNHLIEVVTKLYLVVQNVLGRPSDINISTLFNAFFHRQIVTIAFYFISSANSEQTEQVKIIRKNNRMDIYIIIE